MRAVMYRWTEVRVGDRRAMAMVPHGRFDSLCKRQFVDREDYALNTVEHVGTKSRAGLFAAVGSAWKNFDEEKLRRWPSREHLRKWALVQVGHCTESNYVMDSPADAKRFALGARELDEYAVIIVKGNVVRIATAKSIAGNSIKNEEWQAVKWAVIELVASLVGLTGKQLAAERGDD